MNNEEMNVNNEVKEVANEEVKENTSNQVVKPKKKKKDIRSVLLIFLFLFLFGFVMGMPYVNEWVDSIKKDTGLSEIERKAREIEKEQQKQNSKANSTEEKDKETYTTLICTSATTTYDNYDATVVEKFIYNSKGLVVESSKATTYNFTTVSEKYNDLKNQCDQNSLKYVEKKGYEIACSYNDNQVVMEDKFDLATFTTINDGMTKIEANASYKDEIEKIKKKMETLGYTCE